jgi:hypothetical protein
MVARVSGQTDDDFGTLFLTLHGDTDFLSLMPHIGKRTEALLDSGDARDHQVFEALLADIAAMEKAWKSL